MKRWLQPPSDPHGRIPLVTFYVVVFFGGSLAVFFFVWGVLGLKHPEASSVPMFAWMFTSAWVYVRWTTGSWISQALREQMPMGPKIRRAVVWAVGSGGALVLFNFWPGQEPWPTLVGFSFLGAVVALEVAAWGWRD